MDEFYKYLLKQSAEIKRILSKNTPMTKLTAQQQLDFDNATKCFYCDETMDPKYRHHDHVTGDYIAASCNRCNLHMKPLQFVSNTNTFDDHADEAYEEEDEERNNDDNDIDEDGDEVDIEERDMLTQPNAQGEKFINFFITEVPYFHGDKLFRA